MVQQFHNLGTRSNKPIRAFNIILPHENTVEAEMGRWDPDPTFRWGFTEPTRDYFWSTVTAEAKVVSEATGTLWLPWARLGFDGTFVMPRIEFVRGVIHNFQN